MISSRHRPLAAGRAGFTLTELIIAVGITGIIAGIAIPNYTRFRNRGQQTEARDILSMIYTAEKAFHTEQASYTGCLRKIGILERSAKRYYSAGFDDSVVYTVTGCSSTGAQNCDTWYWKGTVPVQTCLNTTNATAPQHGIKATNAAHASPIHPDNFSTIGAGTVLTFDTFTAVAVGILTGSGATSNYDGWSIDQNKVLLNFQPNT